MKKGIAHILTVFLVLALAGCGSAPARTASAPAPAEAPEQSPAEAPAESGNRLQDRPFPGGVPEDELRARNEETGGTDMEKSLRLFVNDAEVPVEWEENESVEALIDLASAGPLTVQMSMYGGFEQVGPLGTSLPRNDAQTTTQAGDIVLYAGNQLVVFYGSNAWAYTRLGRITDLSEADLTNLLAKGDVVVTLCLG